MAKVKTKKRITKKKIPETDGAFFLKILLYIVVGWQWIYITNTDLSLQVPLPIGLVIGGMFASHDHFQIDRKIEFAILLIACVMGYWSQSGVILNLL